MAPYVRPMKLEPDPRARFGLRKLILPAAVLAVVFAGGLVDWTEPLAMAHAIYNEVKPAPRVDRHYANCAAARADRRFNIPRSDPSYRSRMDSDGDGLACEPHW